MAATGEGWSDPVVDGDLVTLTWTGGELPAGGTTASITVTAEVTTVEPGSHVNVAVVEPNPEQPEPESVPVGNPDRFENGDPEPSEEYPSNNDDSAVVEIGAPTFSLGNRLWFDTGVDGTNNGRYDEGEPAVPGAVVELLDVDGTVIATTVTDDAGFYRFDGLEPGDYVVRVAAENFRPGGPLAGWFSATPTSSDFDTPSNNQDKGVNSPDPSVTGVPSAVVSLGPDLIPLDEIDPDGSGAGGHGPFGDGYDNLTVDFGFVPAYAVGDVVWYDDDRDDVQD